MEGEGIIYYPNTFCLLKLHMQFGFINQYNYSLGLEVDKG